MLQTTNADSVKAVIALSTRGDDEALRAMLEPRHEIRTVGSAQELGALIKKDRVDLLLMDAETSVEPFLETLSAEALGDLIPVITVGHTGNETRAARTLEEGAADYLLRPLRSVEVLSRVEKSLRWAKERSNLKALAHKDALTGLENYRSLTMRLEQELRRAARYGYPLAVVMVDLDHLKQINDALGHEEGNRAILTLADHLRTNLRETDFAARYGGDEFIALLPHQTEEEAAVFAERVRQGLISLRHQLSLSAGVAAVHGDNSLSSRVLLDRADAALYQAKRQGRNRVVIAPRGDQDMNVFHHHA